MEPIHDLMWIQPFILTFILNRNVFSANICGTFKLPLPKNQVIYIKTVPNVDPKITFILSQTAEREFP